MVIQRVFCGYPMMRVLLAIGIDGVVLNACLAQGFDAFLTCATLTAMVLATFVATPCFGIIDPQLFAASRDVGLIKIGIMREQFNAVIRTFADSL